MAGETEHSQKRLCKIRAPGRLNIEDEHHWGGPFALISKMKASTNLHGKFLRERELP